MFAAEPTPTALLLLAYGLLMAVSALFSRSIERIGVPVVLLFLVLGMLAGSEGIGGLHFDDHQFAFRVGMMALVLILFDGGLNTSWTAVRSSIAPASVLATAGVAGTALLVALCARLLGFRWAQALLIGAIVSSTDAAAVFAVLRGGALHLDRRVGTTIELESGVNDPMAFILTAALTTSVAIGKPLSWTILLTVPLQLLLGGALGVAFGFAGRAILTRARISVGGLYPVLTLAIAFLSFGVTTLAQGSGFLAVYATALVLGNGPLPYRNGLARIHDAIAWLSQISMFAMLGLLVFPSELLDVAWAGVGIGLFLAFIARPAVVALCLAPFRFPPREIGYIGWVGLRGAVPIILATFPILQGVPGARDIFNVVFFVVVLNAIVPGATIRWVTRRFGFQSAEKPVPAAVLEVNSTTPLQGEILSFYIDESLAVCNVQLSKINFPPGAAAILIVRGKELVACRGGTTLLRGDHVYVFCRLEDRPFIELLFGHSQQ